MTPEEVNQVSAVLDEVMGKAAAEATVESRRQRRERASSYSWGERMEQQAAARIAAEKAAVEAQRAAQYRADYLCSRLSHEVADLRKAYESERERRDELLRLLKATERDIERGLKIESHLALEAEISIAPLRLAVRRARATAKSACIKWSLANMSLNRLYPLTEVPEAVDSFGYSIAVDLTFA